MNHRLGTVPVYVADQDRALEFYRDTLGWNVVMDTPLGPGQRWLVVQPQGGGTELSLFAPSEGSPFAAMKSRVGEPTGYVFLTDDIQASYATLRDKGVQFPGEPKEESWGWQVPFSDPDGNGFLLVQRKAG